MSQNKRYFIELGLGTIIVFMVLGIVLPRGKGPHLARITATQVEIASFKTALGMFKLDCGRFPTSDEALAALIQRPSAISATAWRGPYLDRDKVPLDPWGHVYVYICPGLHNKNGFDVYSLGKNGKGGGEAVGNWTPP